LVIALFVLKINKLISFYNHLVIAKEQTS